MEENGTQSPFQSTTPRTRLKIFFLVFAFSILGFLIWFSLSKTNTEIVENETIKKTESPLRIEDVKDPDFCFVHPEYCKDADYLKNFEFIDPVYSKTGLVRSSYCRGDGCEGEEAPPKEVSQVELSPEIILSIENKDSNPSLEFRKKTGEPSSIPSLNGVGGAFVAYANENSILVQVDKYSSKTYDLVEEYYYYDGEKWGDMSEFLKLSEKFYFAKEPSLYYFNLSKEGILEMVENYWDLEEETIDLRDKDRVDTLKGYYFLIDPKEYKILAVYLGDYYNKNSPADIYKNLHLFESLLGKVHPSDFFQINPEKFSESLISTISTVDITYGYKGKLVLPPSLRSAYYNKCFDLEHRDVPGSVERECHTWPNGGKLPVSEDVDALIEESSIDVFENIEGAGIAENIKIEFQKKSGEKLKIPPFYKYGSIYFIDENNVLIDTNLERAKSKTYGYPKNITKPSDLNYYNGKEWKNLGFISEILKGFYISGKTPDYITIDDIQKIKDSGEMVLNIAETPSQWYQSIVLSKEDSKRQEIFGRFNFFINLNTEKILASLYTWNELDTPPNRIQKTKTSLDIFNK